ncbi:serine/threonine-protein kinase [Isosphaeraceae bacterium EP7]
MDARQTDAASDPSETVDLHLDPRVDVIDLEPTVSAGPAVGADDILPSQPSGAAVELVRGGAASLTTETDDLRRSRLASAAVFLAILFASLLLWSIPSITVDVWLRPVSMLARFLIAAGVAAYLMGKGPLTHTQVRGAELVLFGGITLVLALAEYFVGLEYIRAHDPSGAITYDKNGLFQLVYLMVIYGMFLPNDAKGAAKVILTMAIVPMFAVVALLEHPEAAEMVHQLKTASHAGSNVMFLVVGAALSIYGAHVLNGLRKELHQARRFGQYQLMSKLGSGGMGEVYLAEHQLLKRPCALKLIREGAGVTPLARARFEREVRSAARLSHPNSIEVYDYGRADDGTFYYVMEYLPGMSLGELVEAHGPLPPGRVVYLLRQACAGLAEAHALGLIHRDLKPGNLFVALRGGESDVAKILDFGLVKRTRENGEDPELTADQSVSGTPTYMAPEQALGRHDLDSRLDIYALGAVAYFALTGRPPFTGSNAMAIMIAHARDPVVPPSRYVAGIPADLEQVILTCLAKDRGDRYPNVKALGAALAACTCAADWSLDRADLWWQDQGPPIAHPHHLPETQAETAPA